VSAGPATADTLRGALYMLTASACFAAMAAMVKLASSTSSPWAMVLVRSLVIVAVVAALVRHRGVSLRFVRHRLLALRSLAGFSAMACYYYALGHAPMADAVTLQYTAPLFVAALAPFTVRERVAPATAAWLVVGFLGVLLVVRPTAAPSPGALAALISAVLAAVAYLSVRALRKTEHPDAIVMHFALTSAVLALPALAELYRAPPSPTQAAWLIGVGLFAAGGQLSLTRAYRHGDAAVVSGLSYIAVVLGVVLGAVVFGEVPSPWTALGGAIVVLCGVSLAWSGRAR
jgi:drug/metabolite transporter (DMT)-like permease